MSGELIGWLRAAATFGMAITLSLTIVAYVKFRIARSKAPHPFIYNLMPVKNTKEYYVFAVLAVITVLLGRIASILNQMLIGVS
jgi:hypothetical protein